MVFVLKEIAVVLLKRATFSERGSCFNFISALDASDLSEYSWVAKRMTGVDVLGCSEHHARNYGLLDDVLGGE